MADALLDYVDLGFEIFGLRGYDLVADAIEFGRPRHPARARGVAARADVAAPVRLARTTLVAMTTSLDQQVQTTARRPT